MTNNVWGNIVLVIYILAWAWMYFYQKKRTQSFGPCLFVISTYLGYSVISLLLFNSEYGEKYNGITMFPMLFLFVMLIIALLPGIKYERRNITRIQQPSSVVLYSFIIMYGISTVATLPSAINNIQNGFILLFSSSNAGEQLYYNAIQSSKVSDYSFSGFIGLLSVFHNYFRDISIFILFYYLSLKERIKGVSLYLAGVLVVDILISIAYGGRTSFAMILFATFVAYFMFRDYWSEKYRRTMRVVFAVLLSLMAIPFLVLTISRFTRYYSSNAAYNSFLSYMGMGNLNFNLFAFNSNGIRYGDRTANEFKRILGFDVPNGILATRAKYSNMNINDGLFYTFVGDFVFDFGPIIAVLLFVVFSMIFSRITKSNNQTIQFHKLLLVYFSLCICAQGGMYLFYYSFQRNWIIVAYILMSFVFFCDYSMQKGNNKFIEKENTCIRKRKIKFIVRSR